MTTLTGIATEVFDAVAAEIGGVIKGLSFTRSENGAYDPATGSYATTDTTFSGRGLAETQSAIKDAFPMYTIVGAETLWFVAETGQAPQEGDAFSLGGTVIAVRDILANGELFRVIVV